MSDATEAEKIIGAPTPVTIAGAEYPLLFDFRALMLVEKTFGGLLDFTDALNGVGTDRKRRAWRTPRLAAVHGGLVAALAHAGMTRVDVDRITAKLIGPGFHEVAKVAEALETAFDVAIPPPPAKGAEGKA